MDGGVFGLLGLIHRHRGAVEYDWRHRFHLGLAEVGRTMSIHEAARLLDMLLRDPSSAVAAAVQEWDHPISQEAAVLADLFDLTFMANSDPKKSKPKPHGIRPWKADKTETRYGDTGGRTREQVIAILDAARNGTS